MAFKLELTYATGVCGWNGGKTNGEVLDESTMDTMDVKFDKQMKLASPNIMSGGSLLLNHIRPARMSALTSHFLNMQFSHSKGPG